MCNTQESEILVYVISIIRFSPLNLKWFFHVRRFLCIPVFQCSKSVTEYTEFLLSCDVYESVANCFSVRDNCSKYTSWFVCVIVSSTQVRYATQVYAIHCYTHKNKARCKTPLCLFLKPPSKRQVNYCTVSSYDDSNPKKSKSFYMLLSHPHIWTIYGSLFYRTSECSKIRLSQYVCTCLLYTSRCV